jgi:hypothetical protein
MKKIVRLTESDLVRIVKRVITESEGELNSAYWQQIRKSLEPLGFKYTSYNEEGSLRGYLYSGKDPFKDYQHGMLEKGDITIHFPYKEVEGGEIDIDTVRIQLSQGGNKQFANSAFQKYKNSLVSPYYENQGSIDLGMKVKDVNSVVSLVKDFLSLKI